MAQQINLFHPVLLAPRHHLAARTMLLALGLWVLALVGISGFSVWRTQALQSELGDTAKRHAQERTRLTQAQASRVAAAGDPAALQQELAQLRSRLSERQRLLEELGGTESERSPAPLLADLARTLPAPVWLSEIRWLPTQVELSGQTLEPEALQLWLARSAEPRELRVQRSAEDSTVWIFRVRHGAASAPATSPATAAAPAASQARSSS